MVRNMHFKTGNIGLSLLLGTAIIMTGCGSNETIESVNVNSELSNTIAKTSPGNPAPVPTSITFFCDDKS